MSKAPSAQAGSLSIAVRELRLVIERILYLTGLPAGYVPAVRDAILYAEGYGLGGLSRLLSDFEGLVGCRADAFALKEEAASATLDGAGQHAWIVAPVALDIAVQQARTTGAASLAVENVVWPEGLRVIEALGARHRIRLSVDTGTPTAVTGNPTDVVAHDFLMQRMIADGLTVTSDLWSALYKLSDRSLTPDSQNSRRHAGPIILLDDGSMLGRQEDEDLDLALIKGADLDGAGLHE